MAELGSFTKAADELEVSRTRASRLVRELEGELGVQLLARTTRNVQLTEPGAAYLDQVKVGLDALRTATDKAAEHGAKPMGRLRVSAPLSFGLLHLAPVITDYREAFPEVTVDLQLSDRHVDLVEEGFDVAVRVGALPDSTLKARRLAAVQRILAAAPGYLMRAGAPATPRDLTEHDCLSFSLMAERTDWRLEGPNGEEVCVSVSGGLTANNGDILVQMATNYGGIVNMPLFLVAPHIADGRLVRVLPDWAPPSTDLHVVWPEGRPPPKLRGFLDRLAMAFSGMSP